MYMYDPVMVGGASRSPAYGGSSQEITSLRPSPDRAHQQEIVCPSPRGGGRPGPHIEGVGTSNLPSARTIVVSPVPHNRGAGFDGGVAARDHVSLPWMAAPTSDRGGEMSPCGVTRSTAFVGCDRPPGGSGCALLRILPYYATHFSLRRVWQS